MFSLISNIIKMSFIIVIKWCWLWNSRKMSFTFDLSNGWEC